MVLGLGLLLFGSEARQSSSLVGNRIGLPRLYGPHRLGTPARQDTTVDRESYQPGSVSAYLLRRVRRPRSAISYVTHTMQ